MVEHLRVVREFNYMREEPTAWREWARALFCADFVLLLALLLPLVFLPELIENNHRSPPSQTVGDVHAKELLLDRPYVASNAQVTTPSLTARDLEGGRWVGG